MNFECKDLEALNFFSNEHTLISSSLTQINIYEEDYKLIVELTFKLLYAKKKNIVKIKFIEVKEFSFDHDSSYYFYNISNLKLYTNDGFYYISLDPDETIAMRSPDDNYLVLSRSIEVYT